MKLVELQSTYCLLEEKTHYVSQLENTLKGMELKNSTKPSMKSPKVKKLIQERPEFMAENDFATLNMSLDKRNRLVLKSVRTLSCKQPVLAKSCNLIPDKEKCLNVNVKRKTSPDYVNEITISKQTYKFDNSGKEILRKKSTNCVKNEKGDFVENVSYSENYTLIPVKQIKQNTYNNCENSCKLQNPFYEDDLDTLLSESYLPETKESSIKLKPKNYSTTCSTYGDRYIQNDFMQETTLSYLANIILDTLSSKPKENPKEFVKHAQNLAFHEARNSRVAVDDSSLQSYTCTSSSECDLKREVTKTRNIVIQFLKNVQLDLNHDLRRIATENNLLYARNTESEL